MELYVCDENRNRLGVVGAFSYLLWRKRYTSHGEAELHVDATIKNIELLRKGNILYRSDDNEAMYIYYRGFNDDEEGRDTLIIKCFSIVRWLDRRIVWGRYGFYGQPENIVNDLIVSQCIRTNNDRIIPHLDTGGILGTGSSIWIETPYVGLLEQVESLCNTYDIGIRGIKTDTHFVIDLYRGVDRTIGQSENARVILSKEFSNVLTRSYEEADNDFKNTVLINGIGDGATEVRATIEQGSGLSRREMFVDGTNIEMTAVVNGEEKTYTPEEYLLVLKQKGLEELMKMEEYISFDCEMDVTKENTKYGRDFFLGDIITIRDDKLGVIMNSRIVEADEIYQDVGKRVQVKVGKSIPTLTEKIKRMVK